MHFHVKIFYLKNNCNYIYKHYINDILDQVMSIKIKYQS